MPGTELGGMETGVVAEVPVVVATGPVAEVVVFVAHPAKASIRSRNVEAINNNLFMCSSIERVLGDESTA